MYFIVLIKGLQINIHLNDLNKTSMNNTCLLSSLYLKHTKNSPNLGLYISPFLSNVGSSHIRYEDLKLSNKNMKQVSLIILFCHSTLMT